MQAGYSCLHVYVLYLTYYTYIYISMYVCMCVSTHMSAATRNTCHSLGTAAEGDSRRLWRAAPDLQALASLGRIQEFSVLWEECRSLTTITAIGRDRHMGKFIFSVHTDICMDGCLDAGTYKA